MDDDIYVFEMSLQIIQLFEVDIPDSRMRVLSKNPRYTADNPANRKTDKKRGNRL